MSDIANKFVQHDIPELESLKDSFEYRVKVKLLNGEPLTREEKDRLAEELSVSQSKASLKLLGWRFTFINLLNEYWVEFTNGDIHRYYAPDKTSLRKCLSHVYRIINVTKDKTVA